MDFYLSQPFLLNNISLLLPRFSIFTTYNLPIMMFRMSVLLFLIVNCNSLSIAQNYSPLDLVGNWKMTDTEQEMGEQWQLKDSSELVGFGFRMKQDSMHITEKLSLKLINYQWQYIAEVGKQQPVSFALDSSSIDVLLFVNKTHDFPQYIRYKFINANKLAVEVGNFNKKRKLAFNFERTKL
jgi:hypothetical protein